MERASSNLIKNTKKQIRDNRHLLFLDNPKIIKDAVKNGLIKPIVGFVSNENKAEELDLPCKIYKTDTKTIESLTDVKTPQGVCVMVEYIPNIVKKPQTNCLVLDTIQDPGNAGTLIRTALAAGFETVVMVDSVNVTNSKLVRSTVGAIFNVNIYQMSKEEFLKTAKEWDLPLLMADMEGKNLFESEINEQIGVVVGNEGKGVCDEIASLCSYSIKIPMNEGIESLNAGVSGAIIMYHINKNKIK